MTQRMRDELDELRSAKGMAEAKLETCNRELFELRPKVSRLYYLLRAAEEQAERNRLESWRIQVLQRLREKAIEAKEKLGDGGWVDFCERMAVNECRTDDPWEYFGLLDPEDMVELLSGISWMEGEA